MKSTVIMRGEEQNTKMEDDFIFTKKWTIKDENDQYVHQHSIKRIGTNNYTYVNYPKVEITYTLERRVQEALECLNLHNVIGKLGHIFTIVELC